ncbi:alpha/beta hydrolase [Magnetovibrio sp. PR-2]|uniref:alpha/beta hydrolase n=1 Tax=Magnetovibrio sp. PR-2 TaxID=3120356 RepID=UPI002FCE5B76
MEDTPISNSNLLLIILERLVGMVMFRKAQSLIWSLAIFGLFTTINHDASAEERNVSIKHDGLTVNAHLVTAEDSSLSDNAILITHGTLGHNGMEVIKGAQATLADRGYNSLALTLNLGLDNRTGPYDCKTPHTHKHLDALDEIGAWLDWLKTQGASKVTLMGHSRGGNQTAWFAAERLSDQIAKVVLLAPQTWDETLETNGYEKRYGVPLAQVLATAQGLVDVGKGQEMMEKIGFIYCPDSSAQAASFVSYYTPDQRMHTPNLISKIKVPVLVIAATEDQVVKGLPEAMGPLVSSEEAQLVVIDGASHSFLDFYAEDVADAVDEFLSTE